MRALRESLVGEEIHALRGVLNGTTTYVLGRLEQQRPFADAVADAQRAGYAERNPADDLSGADAAAKLAILCSIAWREPVTVDRVSVRGIDASVIETIDAAREYGGRVRLVASARTKRPVARRVWSRSCSTPTIRSRPEAVRITSSRFAPHSPER